MRPLTPQFGACVTGLDISAPLNFETFAEVRAAFDRFSILVFLEPTRTANPATGTVFARQSNFEIKIGEVLPPDDRRKGSSLLSVEPVPMPESPRQC
jgi:alpha-ketoglutarate-dependent 2,4-dichlorophenoxyacetate dioxygenase